MTFEISFSFFMHLLNDYGISTLFGPFLVIFSLSYGLLRKANLFGKHERIAAVVAFGFSMYYIANIGTILFTQRFFAMFFYEMLALLLVLMVVALFWGGSGDSVGETWRNAASGVLGLTVLIAALYAYMSNPEQAGTMSFDFMKFIYDLLFNTGLIVFVVLLVAFYILYKWLTAESDQQGTPSLKDKTKDFLKSFADLMDEIGKNEQ